MRKGYSLITAVFIMVLLAIVSAFILNLSGKVVQETTSQYRQEQSALLARSYTELAIMAVMQHDREVTNNCTQDIDGTIQSTLIGAAPGTGSYSVETRIYYLGNNLPCANTRRLNDNALAGFSNTVIATDYNTTVPVKTDALAAIIVDVYVMYKDPDNPTFDITYHRRTLQKI